MSKLDTRQLEKEVHKKIKEGLNKGEITAYIYNKVSDGEPVDRSIIENIVATICDDYPDYVNIQFFMKSKAIIDKQGKADAIHLFNPATRKVSVFNKQVLMAMLSSKVSWSHKIYTCEFVYNPFECFKLRQEDGCWEFNCYNPPFWMEDYFYTNGKKKVTKTTKIPPLYAKFFRHLINNDDASYEYLLDWLATMIKDRNYCILTTIGNQGVGKGVLGQIMRLLLGEDNFTETDKRVLKKDFNGQILNKRLLYLDEIKITTSDQENKLKALVNDFVEVEKKGHDAKTIRNYSSLYFSSNNLDSIRISEDDRRFSIVELTSEKLLKVMTKEQIYQMLQPENIAGLAHYLFHREVDNKKMMEVFRTSRTEIVRSSSLKAWEEWFIDDYCFDQAGKCLPVNEVSEAVEDEFGSRVRPGRKALVQLRSLYPDKFNVVNMHVEQKNGKKKQVWHVKFSETE